MDWAERYIRFHRLRHPSEMGVPEVEAFLTSLAKRGVSFSTQNQALSALLFMYREVLGRDLQNIQALWAKRSTHVPAVLTQEEVKIVLCKLKGVHYLIGQMLYGNGMRLTPALAPQRRCKCGMSAFAGEGSRFREPDYHTARNQI